VEAMKLQAGHLLPNHGSVHSQHGGIGAPTQCHGDCQRFAGCANVGTGGQIR